MSERLNMCPKCGSTYLATINIYNPDTTDMNSKALLKCNKCQHEFEDLITSEYTKKLRARGFRI